MLGQEVEAETDAEIGLQHRERESEEADRRVQERNTASSQCRTDTYQQRYKHDGSEKVHGLTSRNPTPQKEEPRNNVQAKPPNPTKCE